METWSKKQVFVDVNIWFRNKFQVQVMECFVKFFIIVDSIDTHYLKKRGCWLEMWYLQFSENIQEYFQKHGIAYHMRNNVLVVNF